MDKILKYIHVYTYRRESYTTVMVDQVIQINAHFSFLHPSHPLLIHTTLLYLRYLILFLIVPKIFLEQMKFYKIYCLYLFDTHMNILYIHKLKTIHHPSFFMAPVTGILLLGIYPNIHHLHQYIKTHCNFYHNPKCPLAGDWILKTVAQVLSWQSRLHASTAGAWVQTLIRELRSHMPCGVTKK